MLLVHVSKSTCVVVAKITVQAKHLYIKINIVLDELFSAVLSIPLPFLLSHSPSSSLFPSLTLSLSLSHSPCINAHKPFDALKGLYSILFYPILSNQSNPSVAIYPKVFIHPISSMQSRTFIYPPIKSFTY